jgi:ATP-dependent RNA helicase DeaD
MGEYELVAVKKEHLTTELTEQLYVEVNARDKFNALMRIIDVEPDFYGLIFCQTKIETDEVAHQLVDNGYPAESLHGDVSQNQREKILALFKKKKVNMVVATDVAARGIDVNNLTHVINYSLPQEAETYVHRIGRTGRAGKKGVAISLVAPYDTRKFAMIKRIAKAPIERKKLPGIQEIIHKRVDHLKTTLDETILNNGIERYEEIADYLLDGQHPEAVIAALLKMNYEKSFDESAYKEIRESSKGGRGDSNGRSGGGVRLFLAKGKLDRMTPRQLVDFIEGETQVSQRLIDNVKVMEKFSFFTVPTDEANHILTHFKKHGRGRSVVERAKD